MANLQSQIKRNRTNEKARLRNKSVRSNIKTSIRRFHEAVAAGENERAQELACIAGRDLDRAASRGVIHKRQAANRKSAIFTEAAKLS